MTEIELINISKKFKIGYSKDQNRLLKIISSLSGREPKKVFWALQDINFKINPGEMIGIIGKNGAGKTTLLRIIAGIYRQDGGEIKKSGRMVCSIGSHITLPERLTMRDNIYLYGTLLGLDRQEIIRKFDHIVEFCELEDFIDTKLYQFSEGMKIRLISTLLIFTYPDLALIDDIDVTLDKSFVDKFLMTSFKVVKERQGIYLLASHNTELLKHCDRILWLEKGKTKKIGQSAEIIEEYLDSLREQKAG